MKMKIFFAVAFVTALSGCSSVFTSIEPATEANTYYVTEVNQIPYSIYGDLLLCKAEKAEEEMKMVCESVD